MTERTRERLSETGDALGIRLLAFAKAQSLKPEA
jgi:hypothetical protein